MSASGFTPPDPQTVASQALSPQPLAAGGGSVVRRFIGRVFGNAVSQAVGTAAGMATVDVLQPQLQPLVNREWSKHTDRPLSAEAAAAAVERSAMSYDEAEAEAALTGVDPRRFRVYELLAGIPPNAEMLVQMVRRKVITPARMREGLIQGNVRSEWADDLIRVTNAVPSVSQMVHFATRGVYGGGSEIEGTTDEMPDGLTVDAERDGLLPADTIKHWQAHWRLPSPGQLYTMLWRKLIDVPTLDKALKANDYPPYWRPLLRDIAFHTPGRIDLRHLFATGLISEAEVFEGYQALGYNDKHARWMADYAIAIAKPKATAEPAKVDWAQRALGMAFTDVHAWQKKGDMTEAQAASALEAVGIDSAAAAAAAGYWATVLAAHG